jgi:hypothetical protein
MLKIMEFLPASDDNYNLLYERLTSECGIEMAVHPVVFGYRIISGYINSGCIELNWCCGDSQKNVELVYSMMKVILEAQPKENPYTNLRSFSNIKPLFNDAEFFSWLLEKFVAAGGNIERDYINLCPIGEIRQKMIRSLDNYKSDK